MLEDGSAPNDQDRMIAQLRHALALSGIGTRFSQVPLESFGTMAEPVIEHLLANDEALAGSLAAGEGLFAQGNTGRMDDLLCCYLKGLICVGYDVLYTTPDRLYDLIENPTDQFEACTVLGIGRMFDTTYEKNPLSSYRRYRVENHIVSRLNDNMPVAISGHGLVHETSWWSPDLITALLGKAKPYVELVI